MTENEHTLEMNHGDVIESWVCIIECEVEYLGIVWWLCHRIYFLDASAEDYEEAGDYEEEEEENFDICANQGKLI